MKEKRNIAASVRQRLLNKAREQSEEFQNILIRYALERLLYRLSQSQYRNRFILKGAIVFSVWSNEPHRTTRDLDLLSYGENTLSYLEQVFRDICSVQVAADGIEFQNNTVRCEQIKVLQKYSGVRIKLTAILANAQIPIQIDIGFGDAVTPAPIELELPTLLEFPAPKVPTYPRETVVAEKFQAMVMLGIANTRLKDFYDLLFLAMNFTFEGEPLSLAMKATFDRRSTPLPTETPLALTASFAEDSAKKQAWQAFLRKGKLKANRLTLSEVVAILRNFIMPPALAAARGESFNQVWTPGGTWVEV
ncbi:MAG: nucleotidyl transferase AbiEii/AbiGii toxin family protein [Hormoscilla sp. GUM202]|nr:nucleotidyl transferase AbiEii/AbiGii toxin family protein [Hormoscilla sp. GUM202]